jgi:tungstate transport system permease protein
VPNEIGTPNREYLNKKIEFHTAFSTVIALILGFDADLAEIVLLTLRVSLSAVALAALIGLPLGALLALVRSPGRRAAVVLLNALMGLPPVVVGLVVYLLISRAGPRSPLSG